MGCISQEDSFFIADSKLKGWWPKDKDGKMMDPEIVSQLLDMVLGIRIVRYNDKFYIDVSEHSNYQDKKHDLFWGLTTVCAICFFIMLFLLITNPVPLFATVIIAIMGVMINGMLFFLLKEDVLKFRYLRKLRKKVLMKNE